MTVGLGETPTARTGSEDEISLDGDSCGKTRASCRRMWEREREQRTRDGQNLLTETTQKKEQEGTVVDKMETVLKF